MSSEKERDRSLESDLFGDEVVREVAQVRSSPNEPAVEPAAVVEREIRSLIMNDRARREAKQNALRMHF